MLQWWNIESDLGHRSYLNGCVQEEEEYINFNLGKQLSFLPALIEYISLKYSLLTDYELFVIHYCEICLN